MKVRQGFVSNSSSSNFIIGLGHVKPENINDAFRWIEVNQLRPAKRKFENRLWLRHFPNAFFCKMAKNTTDWQYTTAQNKKVVGYDPVTQVASYWTDSFYVVNPTIISLPNIQPQDYLVGIVVEYFIFAINSFQPFDESELKFLHDMESKAFFEQIVVQTDIPELKGR